MNEILPLPPRLLLLLLLILLLPLLLLLLLLALPSRMHIGPYGSKLSQKVANREMNRSSLLLREKSESDVS